MGQEQLNARRQRREWLLRVCSQSLQRQQAGIAAAAVVPVRVDVGWAPVPGWAGQNGPEVGAPAAVAERLDPRAATAGAQAF
jgi:hypothetical protein